MTDALRALLRDFDKQPENLGDTYTWADLVEMKCLVSDDRRVSLESIVKLADADVGHSLEAMRLLGNSADSDPGDLEAITLWPELSDEQEDADSDSNSYGGPAEEDAGGTRTSMRRSRRRRSERIRENLREIRPVDAASPADRRQIVAADVIRLLKWRADSFGESYPFEVIGDHPDTFTFALKDVPTERHYLYTFLLMCASLPLLPEEEKKLESEFTYPFERLAAVALTKIFPTADVRIFGTSSRDESIPSMLGPRIEHLARLLNGTVGKDVHRLSTSNSGDNGLDVYVHVPFGDDQEGRLAVFVQAACTGAWITKQNAATPQAWKGTLVLQVPQVSVCAIPMSFRRSGGDWHDLGKLSETLLLDRSRIMHVISEGFAELEKDILDQNDSRRLLESLLSPEEATSR